MSATTVKIEDPLLREIRKVKLPGQSISAYVKEALEHEIRRRRMAEAAQAYRTLLEESPGELALIKEWESAALDKPVKHKHR